MADASFERGAGIRVPFALRERLDSSHDSLACSETLLLFSYELLGCIATLLSDNAMRRALSVPEVRDGPAAADAAHADCVAAAAADAADALSVAADAADAFAHALAACRIP